MASRTAPVKTKKSKVEFEKAKAAAARLVVAKDRLSEARDEFRSAYQEAADILEGWDDGIGTIETAIRNLDQGLDRLSELV